MLTPSSSRNRHRSGRARAWKARTRASSCLAIRLTVVADGHAPNKASSTSPTRRVATPATNISRISWFTSGWRRW